MPAKIRRLFTLLIPVLLLLTRVAVADPVIPGPSPDRDNAGQPNMVVVILDDWGWQESGAYGNPRIQTPNIDRLAAEGVKFNNTFLTSSLCSPSRASILTGLYPHATGAEELGTPLPEDRIMISHYLREAGYFTASVGKWHLGGKTRAQFDRVILERQFEGEDKGFQSGMEDWLETLEHLPQGKPFFLWLSAKDAHRPWRHEPEWSVHKAEDMAVPAYTRIGVNQGKPEALLQQNEQKLKNDIALYYDELYRADFHIGAVVERLQQQQRLDNTFIIIMSDNGAPFWRAKKSLFDQGLKTPFIIYAPGMNYAVKEVDALVSAIDIAPTLLTLAGIDVPEQMMGHSFLPLLKTPGQGGMEKIRDTVYAQRHKAMLKSEFGHSVRDLNYLYIFDEYPSHRQSWFEGWFGYYKGEQLYDVNADPNAEHNLARNFGFWWSHGGVLERYRRLLVEHRREVDSVSDSPVFANH